MKKILITSIIILLAFACHERPANSPKPKTDKLLHGSWESISIESFEVDPKTNKKALPPVKVWLNFTKYNQLKAQYLTNKSKLYRQTIKIKFEGSDLIIPKHDDPKAEKYKWQYRIQDGKLYITMDLNKMVLKRIHSIPQTHSV